MCKVNKAFSSNFGHTYTMGNSITSSMMYACYIYGKVVSDRLDRHFTRVHKLTPATAQARFGLVKSAESSKSMQRCTLCNKVFRKLGDHLFNVHGLQYSSEESHRVRGQAYKYSLEDNLDHFTEGARSLQPISKKTKADNQVHELSQTLNRFVKWCSNPARFETREAAAAYRV